MQPVQRVVDIGRRSVFRIGEAGAIGGGVVAVAGGEIARRQKRIARRSRSEPSHIVEDERIGTGGIAHLRKTGVEIVGVIHSGSIRIGLLRKAIQQKFAVKLTLNPHPLKNQTPKGAAPKFVSVFIVCATRRNSLRHPPRSL